MNVLWWLKFGRYSHAVLTGCILGTGNYWLGAAGVLVGLVLCTSEAIYEVAHEST